MSVSFSMREEEEQEEEAVAEVQEEEKSCAKRGWPSTPISIPSLLPFVDIDCLFFLDHANPSRQLFFFSFDPANPTRRDGWMFFEELHTTPHDIRHEPYTATVAAAGALTSSV